MMVKENNMLNDRLTTVYDADIERCESNIRGYEMEISRERWSTFSENSKKWNISQLEKHLRAEKRILNKLLKLRKQSL